MNCKYILKKLKYYQEHLLFIISTSGLIFFKTHTVKKMKKKYIHNFVFVLLLVLWFYGFFILNLNEIKGELTSPRESSITVCRNGLNIPILDNQSSYDTINISGIPPNNIITGVAVTIDTIIHSWDADLGITIWKGILLDSLINHRGGSGNNFIGTKLTDTASTPISSGNPPFTGYFRAEHPLSVFNGINPNGEWILEIYDNFSGDQGTLKAWCLTIYYEEPSGLVNNQNYSKNGFSLSQNYPNPFNPTTSIKFSIPKSGLVTLKVYDVFGKEIVTLLNEILSAGDHSIGFNGAYLSSGVYFYRIAIQSNKIEAGEFVDVKKMLLIK